MTTSREELEQQIEKLVSEHLAACHKAVAAAVERAFSRGGCTVAARPAAPVKAASRQVQPRRSAEELEILGEHLYEAICATPGVTMATLAARLEVSPRSLQVPAGQLRRAGRVRSIGRRQSTRYFPMATQEGGVRPPLMAVGREAHRG